MYLCVHRTGKPYDRDKDIIPLKVNQPKQLPFDAIEAGPGTYVTFHVITYVTGSASRMFQRQHWEDVSLTG